MGEILTVKASDARANLAELCERAAHGERVIISRSGKSRVALVPLEDLELLHSLEDELDLELAQQARARAREEGTATLEEVATRLGIEPE